MKQKDIILYGPQCGEKHYSELEDSVLLAIILIITKCTCTVWLHFMYPGFLQLTPAQI